MLSVKPGGLYVDGTVGLAGHAQAVLELSAPDGRLLGCDRDPETLERAEAELRPFGERVELLQADFRELPRALGARRADGILLDLGVSSVQLDTPERGFSFRLDGPLDMRLDRSQGVSAAELVNRLPEQALADLIFRHGEEPASRRIAKAIVTARRARRIATTLELAQVVRSAAGRARRPGLDTATLTFQALRIEVNRELQGLEPALAELAACLKDGGRLAVISFHSLEDRAVKQGFRTLAQGGGFRLLTRKPVMPGDQEQRLNPRARSARLRGLLRQEAA